MKMDKDTEVLLIKLISLCNLLVEILDELGGKGFYRQSLKRAGNRLLRELETFINRVWKGGNKQVAENTERIQKVSQAFEDAVKQIL